MEQQQFYEEVVTVASSLEQEPNNTNTLMDQDLSNPHEEERLMLFAPEPLNFVIDSDLLNKIALDFKNQLVEVVNKMRVENPLDHQHAQALAMVPTTPMMRPENAQDTPTSVGNKRGRKQSTMLIGETTFSFKPPEFCIEGTIDIDKVLKCRFKEESGRNHAPKFSATERMQNWKVEQRQRSTASTQDFEKLKNSSTPTQDFYYYHLPSQLKLRSKPLVYNFLLNGTYPSKNEAKELVEGSSSGKSSKKTKK